MDNLMLLERSKQASNRAGVCVNWKGFLTWHAKTKLQVEPLLDRKDNWSSKVD